MSKITFILGGARSGKSTYAENLANPYQDKIYLATAKAYDEEMQERISAHKSRRDQSWQTIECHTTIAHTINSLCENDENNGIILPDHSKNGKVILIDCMTLWLSNLMMNELNIENETAKLVIALEKATIDIIMVSNEVGLSIVPENKLARNFRDFQGTLNQTLAKVATNVVFIAAGLPLILKQTEFDDERSEINK